MSDKAKLQEEINALKAQVEAMRQKLEYFASDRFEFNDGSEHLNDAIDELIDKAPQQCLADFKISFITSIINDIEMGMANMFLDGDDVLEYLKIQVNRLKG